MTSPILSAIVSTYRADRFMQGCLEDLTAQTIADRIEILVIDSASPGREREIVEEFQTRFGNIRYVRTEVREPLYVAWNRGIRMARGTYLTSANTDDRHHPAAFEKITDALEREGAALGYADAILSLHENETWAEAGKFLFKRWLEPDPRSLFRVNYVGSQPVWRRDLHDRYGFFDESMMVAADYEFWLRICRTERFVHLAEPLGVYLASPGSIEHRNPAPSWREQEISRERYWPKEWGKRPRAHGLLVGVDPWVVLRALSRGDMRPLRDLTRFGWMMVHARSVRGRDAGSKSAIPAGG